MTVRYGLALFKRGQVEAARAQYLAQLGRTPHNAQALNLLGVLELQCGQLQLAGQYLQQAARLAPGDAKIQTNLAMLFARQGRLDQAEHCYRQALQQAPNGGREAYNLGCHLFKSGNWEAAVFYLWLCECRLPNFVEATNNLALCYLQLGMPQVAIRRLQVALQSHPMHAALWVQLGQAYQQAERPPLLVIQAFEQALQHQPEHVAAWNNLGNYQLQQRQPQAAIAALTRAHQLAPNAPECATNLAKAYQQAGQISAAIQQYTYVLQRWPQSARARYGLALCQLSQHSPTPVSWANYAARWQLEEFDSVPLATQWPSWRGEPFAAFELLLWPEQGVGDQIFFATQVTALCQRYAPVTIAAEARLQPLLARTFPTCRVIKVADIAAQAAVRVQLPYGSIGQFLPPTQPATGALLKCDASAAQSLRQQYRERFGRRCIGIAWDSRQAERCCPLVHWQRLLVDSEWQFISLQHGVTAASVAAFNQQHHTTLWIDPSIDSKASLEDYAAQIASLDAVITIDNTTVHVAGGLGVPTWLMLPQVPDWRWGMAQATQFWYPSVQGVRQSSAGQWAPVIVHIQQALRQHFTETA